MMTTSPLKALEGSLRMMSSVERWWHMSIISLNKLVHIICCVHAYTRLSCKCSYCHSWSGLTDTTICLPDSV